ncbi:hypothetical protein [Chitinophaga tropicalis]|uniref:Tetratricopeptide repeat protein n=1 Tax=Chitinophaga tropicalis TaxID=2683588 RepID=A0A7K1TY56_9BACT|nr:hypothetical protein [Chitinophaga tropicalis]MVT06980.1 hypothetical protein [Chitinophaga tropicalis]
MKTTYLILLSVIVSSCNYNNDVEEFADYDLLETLYHQHDTLIRYGDTVKIVNSKLDTTIIETGIFTYLQYDFPLTVPYRLIILSRKANGLKQQGKEAEANVFFKKVIDFYQHERPHYFKYIFDMKEYFQFEINAAILCSYAYENLKDLENAIMILEPFLANTEARSSRIQERYIQLCTGRRGK